MITIEFLRQFRISNYALFDFIITFLIVYLIAPFLSKLFLKIKIIIPKKNWLFLTLPFSILIHLLFNNITPLTKNFLDLNNYYLLKIIILILFILGIKGIKIKK